MGLLCAVPELVWLLLLTRRAGHFQAGVVEGACRPQPWHDGPGCGVEHFVLIVQGAMLARVPVEKDMCSCQQPRETRDAF